MSRGAAVTQADGIEQGLNVLRVKGADLIMVDVSLPIRTLVAALADERIRTGGGLRHRHDAKAAVAAIQAGAKEYIPLPPDPELIAAVLEAVVADARAFVWRGPRDGAGGQARRAGGTLRCLGADHRRERHRQGGAGAHVHLRSNRAQKPSSA